MKQSMALALVACLLSPSLLANEYQQAQQFALQQQAQSLQALQAFDKKSLPNFNENPREAELKPTSQGELKSKGEAYIQINAQARSIKKKADEFKEIPLDGATEAKAQEDYSQAEAARVSEPCSDGSCLEVSNEDSDDIGVGTVELGALGEMARDVRDKQANSGEPLVFSAKNIACRERWGDVYQNYCRRNGIIIRATSAEKELHVAQKEGRALRVPGGFFCSRERKRWGKRKCVEKKQSWCVFQSKLALIIQEQGRRQLGLNFGVVRYHLNGANCKGFTPLQLSQIQFDTPQMQVALNEVMRTYTDKRTLPSQINSARRIEDNVNEQRGAQ